MQNERNMRGNECKMKGHECKKKGTWEEMKTNDDICWLSTKDALTHKKQENSHLLSTGSSPPEKTIRVKKNDNVILGHLNRYRVFIQPPTFWIFLVSHT